MCMTCLNFQYTIQACSYIQKEYLLEGVAVLRRMKCWGFSNCYWLFAQSCDIALRTIIECVNFQTYTQLKVTVRRQ